MSLYPGTHPAIQASLGRLVTAAGGLTRTGEALLVVHPGAIMIGDRAAVRPDASIGELASLLHGRLVGSLRIHAGVDAEDWRRFLLLVASTVDDLIAQGGIAKAWAATGRGHVDIEEIDYAAVLKERASGDDATWDNVLGILPQGRGRGARRQRDRPAAEVARRCRELWRAAGSAAGEGRRRRRERVGAGRGAPPAAQVRPGRGGAARSSPASKSSRQWPNRARTCHPT